MGDYYLAGSEYHRSDKKEDLLAEQLRQMLNRAGVIELKSGQHTIIFRAAVVFESCFRREERIEEGHMTIDQVIFQLVSQNNGWSVFLPVADFLYYESAEKRKTLHFQGYQWLWRETV